MAASGSPLRIAQGQIEIPAALRKISFALCAMNLIICLMAYLSRAWIYDRNGLGIPTDFISFWASGHLALDGIPAQAFEWDVLKRVEIAKLGQDFEGDFPWHYPPPFFFVACGLALLPYSVAYLGWILASLVPYLAVMRAIVGHNFGILLALATPFVFINALVGQNGFLTAALIGGTLYLIPIRPALAGICLGLLTYKPQYGLLFPIVLIAAGHWRVFISATVTTIAVFVASWLTFGIESWLAFFHWLPKSSQAIMTEGKATWWKLQSFYSIVRYFGGAEQLAWTFQFILAALVAAGLALMWRSRLPYSLKAAALAAGTLLATPYVAIYDMVVLAIAVAFLVRTGLRAGFRSYELAALACTLVLVAGYFAAKPTGLGVTLIVSTLILARVGSWWRRPVPGMAMAGE
ncbi:glycosyltransferase family 87 protein [Bradyrhizobium sp. USDA 3458]|uniref:glycosyltransferase family 87 protein n=1 Tax=Bradyrhizobium sp. USDA 3458 TaxID=2591461 RepID=UPI001144840B|nr:glycosyltransferase family 87 protein [Bradyrhizobium sp. USDA 3458]